jgi:hypothetical protein
LRLSNVTSVKEGRKPMIFDGVVEKPFEHRVFLIFNYIVRAKVA